MLTILLGKKGPKGAGLTLKREKFTPEEEGDFFQKEIGALTRGIIQGLLGIGGFFWGKNS